MAMFDDATAGSVDLGGRRVGPAPTAPSRLHTALHRRLPTTRHPDHLGVT